MPIAALLVAILAGCELVPNVENKKTVGCHTKHINCQCLDYQSLPKFISSLEALTKNWSFQIRPNAIKQLNVDGLNTNTNQLFTLDDYMNAIKQRPEDIYWLIKHAKIHGYSPYDCFLIEQVYLRSIIDSRQFLRNK
jgi:hypothetical protein